MLKTDKIVIRALTFVFVTLPLCGVVGFGSLAVMETAGNDTLTDTLMSGTAALCIITVYPLAIALPEFVVRRIERRVTGNDGQAKLKNEMKQKRDG